MLQYFIRSRVVGPWCLLVCLTEGIPIPSFQWPIFNVAMRNCIVTCSHIPQKEKAEIKLKVQSMGGIYTDNLVQKNTHLVTDSVLSEKYAVSTCFLLKKENYKLHPKNSFSGFPASCRSWCKSNDTSMGGNGLEQQ